MSSLTLETTVLPEQGAAGVVVVRLIGSLDTQTSAAAMERLLALGPSGEKKGTGMLECSALAYVSSAGLRVFLTTTKKLTAAGGALRLWGLNERVKEVFEISAFHTIFKVFASEADALTGF